MRQVLVAAAVVGLAGASAGVSPVMAQTAGITIEQYRSDDPMLSLGSFAFAGGKTLALTVGVGSGAFRRPTDPPFQIWAVGDRGPNIACSEAKEVTGVERATLCAAANNGRIYPRPGYSPSIYGLRLLPGTGRFVVTDVLPIKDASGVPVDGLLNPLTVATTEIPLDGAGARLAQNANAVDAEGVVRLADGSFWVGEENGPSLIQISAEGRILARHVPAGTEGDFRGAAYPVQGTLPAILAKRATNRGIESIAIDPDERLIWTIVQNPLMNPDAAAYRDARNARILAFDRAAGRVVAQYVYQMEPVSAYQRDRATTNNTVRISEMLALGGGRFVVLERTELTTKLYEISVAGATNILGTRWDDAATRPSLEQSNDLAPTGVVPVAKTLRFDSHLHPEIPTKIEGLAILGDGSLMMINDDDFGITGGSTIISVVRGTGIRMQ
ncbi:MAG: esterase-like activity of phytase family protein [Alphaproteobacteria bacterium]|nr:esterase-like activity of phytase family protein [Alphaproteobacteria bacterium]